MFSLCKVGQTRETAKTIREREKAAASDHRIPIIALTAHAMLESGKGILFMASDTPSGMSYRHGTDMSMSLSGEDEAELRGYFEKLSVGGTITMPMEKAPWGDTFGMLKDKFGVDWLVNVAGPRP